MGRRDAVQVTIEVVARMRHYLPNLVVSYEPGWERRGNGTSANYEFANVHHTATPTSLDRPFPTQALLRDGRPGLPGPLCNEAGPACTVDAPRIHVLAAHPANHAGASRASGPVPALSLYNPRARGLEVDYAGSAPMLVGQLLVAHVWARANAEVLAGGNVEHVRSHAETSITGKWDPGFAPGRTLDMGAFRAAAASLRAGSPAAADPIPSGDTMRLVKAVGTAGPIYLVTDLVVEASNDIVLIDSEARANGVQVVDLHPAQIDKLVRSRADRRKALGLPAVAAAGPDVDEQALAQHLAPLLAAGVGQLDDDDLARIADAAADEVDRRARTRLASEA